LYDFNPPQKKVYTGIFFYKINQKLQWFFPSILLLVVYNLTAQDTFLFSDSTYTYSVNTGTYKKSQFKRYLRRFSDEGKKEALLNLLDSTGYFDVKMDTVGRDTLSIDIGKRSTIDSISIQCARSFTMDSVLHVRFPVYYDAGQIQAYAHKALAFLARRGYPFAKLSIMIFDVDSLGTPSDSGETDQLEKHLRIQFIIDTQKRCVFGDPLFGGEFKTKKKLLAHDIVFQKGQPFDIRKVETSQKRLISRNYIADVSTASPGIIVGSDSSLIDTSILGKGSEDSIDVVSVPFSIDDNSGMGIDGVVAYQSKAESQWSGLLNLTMLNIFHFGEAVSLYYRGEELLQQFSFGISVPFIFGLPLFCSASFGLEINEGSPDPNNKDDDFGYLKGELEVLTQLKGLWQAGGAVKGHETISNGGKSTDYFYGFDLILRRSGEQYRAGVLSKEFNIRTGTGIADRPNGKFTRWNFDFAAGSHIPFFRNQALLGRFVTEAITLNVKDTLHEVEQNRVGGHNSIRGYAEEQFPFNNVAYVQTEYLLYFNPIGSVYIFMDGGVGFPGHISLSSHKRTDLFGYGAGIRIPVRFGTLSLEYARNYEEGRGPGRIHLRVRNTLSAEM
jgi:hypothetical protein